MTILAKSIYCFEVTTGTNMEKQLQASIYVPDLFSRGTGNFRQGRFPHYFKNISCVDLLTFGINHTSMIRSFYKNITALPFCQVLKPKR